MSKRISQTIFSLPVHETKKKKIKELRTVERPNTTMHKPMVSTNVMPQPPNGNKTRMIYSSNNGIRRGSGKDFKLYQTNNDYSSSSQQNNLT